MSMLDGLSSGEDYFKKFDTKSYLKSYYSDVTTPWLAQVLKYLHGVFSKDTVENGRLLDVGSGPTIHQIVSASQAYPHIVCSEYLPENYNQIEKWRDQEADAFDWSETLMFIADLEGNRSEWQSLEARTRAAIDNIVPCNVLQDDVLAPNKFEPFDAILTVSCLEVACTTYEIYDEVLKRLASLLKQQGRLIMTGEYGESFYKVGDTHFHCLNLKKDHIEGALQRAGFTITDWNLWTNEDENLNDLVDCSAMFNLTAVKN